MILDSIKDDDDDDAVDDDDDAVDDDDDAVDDEAARLINTPPPSLCSPSSRQT